MRSLRLIFASSILLLSPLNLQAQVVLGASNTGTTSTSSGATATQGGLGGVSYVPSVATTPLVSKTDAMITNAKNAAAEQDKGKKTAMIVAGVMGAIAAGTCPGCGHRGTCSICAASVIGAAGSLLTAQKMSQAKNISDTQAYDVDPLNNPKPSEIVISDTPAYQNVAKEIDKAAADAGMKLAKDLSGLKTADGRDLNTAKAVGTGAGLSSGEKTALADGIKKGLDSAAKELKDAKLKNDAGEDLVGGGGAASGRGGYADTTSSGGAKAAAKDRQPSSVAGAFKEYNGEKIGVAVDSMFEMMHRRYKHHGEERDTFIKQ